MVQRMLSLGVITGELSPGAAIHWFLKRRMFWRTGAYVRTIKRGRQAGFIEIRPTAGIPRKRLILRPEYVKPFEPHQKQSIPNP